MGARAKYCYPAAVGERVRLHTDGTYRQRNHIQKLAHQFARNRGWVYRCLSDGADVIVRRAA